MAIYVNLCNYFLKDTANHCITDSRILVLDKCLFRISISNPIKSTRRNSYYFVFFINKKYSKTKAQLPLII